MPIKVKMIHSRPNEGLLAGLVHEVEDGLAAWLVKRGFAAYEAVPAASNADAVQAEAAPAEAAPPSEPERVPVAEDAISEPVAASVTDAPAAE